MQMISFDDRKLVRRCLGGQPDAFGALFDRHAPRVYRFLQRLTGNDATAQDLAQETFLAAYRSLGEWRGDGALGTWLCGIAFRLYRSAARKVARLLAEPLDFLKSLPTPVGKPHQNQEWRELQERL